jgi:hypothetical protein
MRKIYLTIMVMFLFIFSYSQTNFVWEKTDTISCKKDQIYSLTKLFIAENWVSSKKVIENDDKEFGLILLKGKIVKNVFFMLGEYVYVYSYNVTFRMQDGKYKIKIDNVYCEDAFMTSNKNYIAKIEPFDGDNCPETGTFKAPGITSKKAIPMMNSLKSDLQLIFDNYSAYLIRNLNNLNW